jgi:hypothetical protein
MTGDLPVRVRFRCAPDFTESTRCQSEDLVFICIVTRKLPTALALYDTVMNISRKLGNTRTLSVAVWP